jgi:hypothetical protein
MAYKRLKINSCIRERRLRDAADKCYEQMKEAARKGAVFMVLEYITDDVFHWDVLDLLKDEEGEKLFESVDHHSCKRVEGSIDYKHEVHIKLKDWNYG